MMNINEYFDKMFAEAKDDEAFDAVCEYEEEVYEMEEDEFMAWAEKNHIDLTASRMVMGHEVTEVKLWCWDMCGD